MPIVSLPEHVIRAFDELRCTNCDSAVDGVGKWIDDDDWYGEDPNVCPYCDAKMRQIR